MAMTKYEVEKLNYLDELIKSSNPFDDDDKEYVKALNSAIDTCRKNEQDELHREKMKHEFDLDERKLEQQLEIEKLKLENQLEIEKIKAEASKSKEEKPTKLQQALEWAKVIVPTVVPIIAYGIYQERMLKFEETGTIHSKVGREMHLPKFMK